MMIKKANIKQVDNGYTLIVELESFEKFEFVETTMEGILIILYKLQALVREREANAKLKPKRKAAK